MIHIAPQLVCLISCVLSAFDNDNNCLVCITHGNDYNIIVRDHRITSSSLEFLIDMILSLARTASRVRWYAIAKQHDTYLPEPPSLLSLVSGEW